MKLSLDYIKRVMISADGTTRLIAVTDGFIDIQVVKGIDFGYPYTVNFYMPGAPSPCCGVKSLQAAYKLIREGNPALN
jgi:hypothetical protein